MDSKLLIAVLLVSILVFGCTSPPSGGTTQPNGTGQTPGNQSVPPLQPNGTQPGAGTVPSDNGGTQPNGGTTPNGGNDLVGKTYEQLLALGIPLECDVTTTSGGTQTTIKLYKGVGTDNMRSEMTAPQGTCPKVISIMNGDKYYTGCEGGEIMPGSPCKWLEFTANATSGATAGAPQKPDYSDVPPAQITCVPWVPDPSKLQAPAGACSMDDLMKNIPTN